MQIPPFTIFPSILVAMLTNLYKCVFFTCFSTLPHNKLENFSQVMERRDEKKDGEVKIPIL